MGSRCCKPKVVKPLLERIIESNKIVIFSKSNCAYCTDVKTMFSQMGVGYAVVELDHCHNVQDLIKSLVDYTGHYTVPQVFIDGKFIGGEIDIFHMRSSGELRKLLHGVFHGLAYNQCPIDVLTPCNPTLVGPRAGLPKSWSTPEAFIKYKPIGPSLNTPVKQYPVYRKTDQLLYPEYR